MKYYEFYSRYLELPSKTSKEGFINVKCPIHHDSNPSAGVDVQTGVFNCHVCGAFSPAKFLHAVQPSISLEDAYAVVEDYKHTHGVIEKIETFSKTRVRNPKWDSMYEEAMSVDLSKIDFAIEYAEARGLSMETLKEAGVGYLPASKTHWKRDSLVFPYFYNGHVVGLRYRDRNGSKGGEEGCFFTLWGVDDLDNGQRVALLAEGESDRLRMLQVLRQNGLPYPVVSTPTGAFKDEWAREFEGYTRVLLVPQADGQASKMIDQTGKILKNKFGLIQLPWRRKQMGKDFCDWLRYNEDVDFISRVEAIVGDSNRKIMSGLDFKSVANKPRRYLINRLLARRQVAVIAGPPKNMKTWFVLNMVRSMITGEELGGIPDLHGGPDHKTVRVLIIEEEGDEEELYQRASNVLQGTDWEQRTFWAHHLGVRLTDEDWVREIEEFVHDNQIDCIILDPLQRMHSGDENSVADMGEVWNNIHRLTSRFKHLSIIVLHHFNKSGDIATGWNAIRGSSRTAAEADLGIFIEKRAKSEGVGIKVKFDGRTLPDMETPDGKDVFKFAFSGDNGLFTLSSGKVMVSKHEAFFAELRDRGNWTLEEAAKHFGCSVQVVRGWMSKEPNRVGISQKLGGRVELTYLGGETEE